MTVSPRTIGFHRAPGNGDLGIYYNGNLVGSVNASLMSLALVAPTTLNAVTTVTAGTGVIVTTGNYTQTASDHRVTAGNVRLGVVSSFGTTQPTSAYVMKEGTAPVGAITTSGGIFSTSTVIFKIIADGSADAIGA